MRRRRCADSIAPSSLSKNTHGLAPLTPLACSLTAQGLSSIAATRAAEIAPATPEIFAPDAISGSAGVGCLTQAQ
jgi:hypothetical protein